MTTAERQDAALQAWLRRRDDRSLAEACEAWDPLPKSWAARYIRMVRSSRLEMSDLLQEARIGLINGFRHFDPTIGAHFQTYASWRIRGAVSSALRSTHFLIRPPGYLLMLSTTARRMGLKTVEEIARALDISEERAAEVIGLFALVDPISSTWHSSRDGREAAAEWDRAAPDPEMERAFARETLAGVLPRMREVDRETLERLYLDGATLAEAGGASGISRQAIYRREMTALAAARRMVGT